MKKFHDIAHERSDADCITNGFGRLVDEASTRFEGAGVQVYRWNGHYQVLVPAEGNAISEADGPSPRPLGTGAAGRAAQCLAPVLISNYRESVGHATPAGRAGVLAAIAVPLCRDGDLVGAISVGTDDDGQRLGPDELDFLQALSNGWSTGDEPALLSAIYDAYRRRAFGLAYRLLRDRDLAEEAVQDVFLAIWRSGAQHDPQKGSLSTWVLTMVRRRAIDTHRTDMRRPIFPIDENVLEVQGGRDPSVEAPRSADFAPIYLALEDLPADQRQAIELAYFAGLSHTQIATKLQTPVGTIKGRIRLALERLRRTDGLELILDSDATRTPAPSATDS